MNANIFKLILLVCIIFQVSCGVTFKRKTTATAQHEMSESNYKAKEHVPLNDDEKKEAVKDGELFNENDSQIIASYYANISNTIIRQNMIAQTKTSKDEENKLVAGEYIPRTTQVIPLPLSLERMLSSLPLHVLRVHVGSNVILMNVKSRRILDIIKI